MVSLAEAIKKQGAAAMVQLSHAGARCVPLGGEMQGASPSGFIFRPDVPSFSMNQAQIDRMVYDFAEAAFRAAEAGFDGVEIHGAHFYLISQFLSPLTNQRQDRYGGDAAGRATFALEVIKAARQRVGRSYPIFFRINAVEKVEGGQTLAEAQMVGCLLANAGVDALDVSLIAQSSWREAEGRRLLNSSSALPKDQPAGANVVLAAKLKEATGLPVMAVGKLGLGTSAEEAVADAGIDLAAVGRQMICDPDTAKKILSHKSSEIIPCKECLNCFATIGRGAPMACTVNKEL
jgi:2,4-dienoyl-CoA reductase-like NADH-dependent reductase (Old Yellow Enzyme family)